MTGKPVIVAAVSDLHGRLESFPACDVAMIAGDICPIEDHSPSAQRRFLEREFAPWLRQLPAKHVVGIAGNHDLIFARDSEPSVPCLPWQYLQDSEADLCGLRVYGTPWIEHMGGGWVFQAPKSQGGRFLAERFSQIPDGLDIVLAHTPPYGLCDLTLDGDHTGSRALLGAIRHKHPRLVVCGHLHEARSATGIGTYKQWTVVANVCAMNWDYQPTWRPMVFSIPPRTRAGRGHPDVARLPCRQPT